MQRFAVALGAVFILVSQTSGAGFLELSPLTQVELESKLLSELAEATSSSPAHNERIAGLQALLQPMYDAVPQEPDGTLSHAVVRYILHRHFAKHRGWFVRGLEPRQNGTQGSEKFQEWVPDYLQNLLEHMIDKDGLNLRDVAVFAATLEDFVHKEEHEWLKQVYKLLWFDTLEKRLTKDEMKEVVEIYLMIYNLENSLQGASTPSIVRQMYKNFIDKVKGWEDTQAWFTNLLDSQWASDAARTVDFEEASQIVQNIGEQYGSFNDGECLKMKHELLSIESLKPGRVRLTDFYKKSLYGSWEFNEKIDYLRSLGTLDESDPTTPLVIVPNYVASRPQCLVSSSYYALCCRNECEDLIGALEREIKASHAAPMQIAQIVVALSSSTVAAPRGISGPLLSRLEDVASLNGGQVPLHGRLFAQWMHHAFPRECPYPHVAGIADPQTADEWMKQTGQQNSKASEEEMLSHVSSDTCKFSPVGIQCDHGVTEKTEQDTDLPWSQVEELLVVRPAIQQKSANLSKAYARDFVVFVILFGIVSFLLRISKNSLIARRTPSCQKPERCLI